ncbi:MAG: AAA family ATPase [Candidatus Aenigmatarchaeota archaeon]
MTRIEKLEMQGFKSFAKKTVITFPSNFSVIAGPNGSGKSNVLDSICFVLGRTSAKSLRADRMMEMIFHGSKTKPPAEFAKVTLYFDNSEREFPIDEDKLIISRKINQKGISTYKLNGKTVTRETIQEILRPARIYSEGHNIILQGDVTDIIEMSPLERRELLDEISGVKEFDEKREKAQRELMTVEERLKESSIVLMEKRATLERLDSERKAAQQYQKLTSELDKLRASLAKQRLQEAEDAMKKLDKKISEIASGEIDKEIEAIDKEIENLEKKRNEISKKLFDRSKDIAIIKEVERIKAEINRKKDKIEMNKIEIERINDIIKRLELIKQKEIEGSVSKAVQDVLKLGWTGVYGTIASLSSVPNEYQIAIEVAAGPHLHDIVVSNENIAIECVNYLKKNKIGRATFLPLDKIKPRNADYLKGFLNKEGVIGIALDLIKFDKKYFNAFSFVFGETLVIDKIETAKKLGIGEARYVTLDGDLIEKSGAIIGGFYIGKKVFTEIEDIKTYSLRKEQIKNEIEKLENEIIKLNKELEQLITEEQVGSKEIVELQKEREEIEQKYEAMKTKRKRLFEEKMNSQEEINKLRIKRARLEAELDNLKLEFENYKKIETYNLSSNVLENKIKETLNAINALGPINMKALDEYNQQKIVYDELKQKVDKLTEERNKILEIMAEIEGKRKDVFMKTLEGIREQFKIVFKDLMGGEADIRLIGGMDSGLLIEANPSGRKLLNIDAMSGGEKTLTALAFLFAIQRYKPAPFYILDEIDAALDKPNTKKTVELIKKYSEKSQFIVISHNETTMQAADCVYGVSMTEGESQIVGIKMPS